MSQTNHSPGRSPTEAGLLSPRAFLLTFRVTSQAGRIRFCRLARDQSLLAQNVRATFPESWRGIPKGREPVIENTCPAGPYNYCELRLGKRLISLPSPINQTCIERRVAPSPTCRTGQGGLPNGRCGRWQQSGSSTLLSETEGGRDACPTQNSCISEDRPVLTRRSLFLGAAATLVCAPAIVRAANIMAVRKMIDPVQRFYYGFNERLKIDWEYRTGQLQGIALANAVEHGVLDHLLLGSHQIANPLAGNIGASR